jgi:ribosomal protein S27E
MSAIYIECPSCGEEGKITEKIVGSRIKCTKCGHSFIAEVGGTYDLVKSDRPPDADLLIRPSTTGAEAQTPRGKSKRDPDVKKPDPKLEKLLEDWADE